MIGDPIGLYLHIPFCQAICSYCNFNRGLFDRDLKTRYVAALEREIREAGDGRPADTVFFGGGTPSLLEPIEVSRVLAACRDAYQLSPEAEITLETNPETATVDRLAAFREAGVNRISFGVQSFDDAELKRLDRLHSAARAKEAIGLARAAGFRNLSFDLMFWLPGQSLASWLRTVDEAMTLSPEHLSLYLLELYPNSPLKETMARAQGQGPKAPAFAPSSFGGQAGPSPMPQASSSSWTQTTDDEAADMYLQALERLDAAGYAQYEISNVSRPGFWSRHNVKYWQGGAWRGFGCGAHSTIDGARWSNIASTSEYVEAIGGGRAVEVGRQVLSAPARFEEALFTGLRMSEGIDCRNIQQRHGVEPWIQFGPALAPLVDEGLMWRTEERFGLTRRGMLVANEILTTFV
ncbi:MAG TPA: coproporphyrinogen-III oxidase family protein [Vicinamibacterales bacterium]|nr:coproporphyrinogen-III oxidase family protein [Vicinamibacterales bacterium]